ncbi:hypothetical protein D5S18_26525 [Nocardia panacis]|uniref:Methionine synthase n=1 Tax=Nocardia panacis TaxID=2340916 RepID=A0A3A4KAZ1_9NOCA|nr:hypothetical protein [Nocardia panacis]RJO70761.1 hypothetical protein D5S18_26525 [Nocardia panacis]
MNRHIHFVGSLPAPLMTSHRGAMEWILEHGAGQPLATLPCDLEPDWMVGYLRGLAARRGAVEFSCGSDDYVDYDHMPAVSVRRGATLRAEDVGMRRVERITHIVAAYRKLRQERPEIDGVRLQLSQPGPLDMSLLTFGGPALATGLPLGPALRNIGCLGAALRHTPVFARAVLEEIAEITAAHGSIITWQVESPVSLLSMIKGAQFRTTAPLAAMMARYLAGFLSQLHGLDAHASLHLCYGDHNHTALLRPTSLAPAVALLNRLGRELRRLDVPLPTVHIPCAFGAEPAPLEQSFYTPLRRLDPAWNLIAGVVSPHSILDSMLALRLFELAADRPVHAVATACGLGRCTVEVAEQAATATATTAMLGNQPQAAWQGYALATTPRQAVR